VPPAVELFQGSVGGDPVLEVALAGALLDAVARGEHGPTLRSYRPPPTVAFGRQDAFLAGFPAAAEAARLHGFTPALRAPGGHAAAYDEGCLVIDEIMPEREPIKGIRDRFADEAERQAEVLRRLGIDARIGKVAGEYCPGDFTVSARGKTKLIGTAQRIVRGAWLFSSVVVVERPARVRAVLEETYAALELDWDPRTVGAVEEEAPGLTVADVERALLENYADRYRLVPSPIAPVLLAAAAERAGQHRI
jgi:lipoate-protein ligase A